MTQAQEPTTPTHNIVDKVQKQYSYEKKKEVLQQEGFSLSTKRLPAIWDDHDEIIVIPTQSGLHPVLSGFDSFNTFKATVKNCEGKNNNCDIWVKTK